jgi:steroid delta-isomerase-like uncharacterized protein
MRTRADNEEGTMTNAKELNERWIRAFNERDWETERAFRSDDYLAHMSGGPGPLDNEGWAGFMAMFTSAFTDARISIDSAVEEGGLVASRWTITGTHDGPFQGVPATGKSVTIPGIDMSRVVDGKGRRTLGTVRPHRRHAANRRHAAVRLIQS